MRIFLTLISGASQGTGDQMWKDIFYETLTKLGHDVIFLPYDKLFSSKSDIDINKVSEKIYDHFLFHHKQKPFNLFLSYYHSGHVSPELFAKINEHTFSVNYTTNFHQINAYEPLLKEANLSIYASKEAESYFNENAANSYYMPFAGLSSNLNFKKKKNGKMTFIGSSYGNRANYLWRCLQKKLPLDIYGPNWINNHGIRSFLRTIKLEYQLIINDKSIVDTAYRCLNDSILREITKSYPNIINGPLSDSDYALLLSKSSIVLNIPESRFEHDYTNPNMLIGANLRDFEVPTTGSFLLTQSNEEIKSLFEDKKEIETFNNEWEMVDKARFYLNNPNKLIKIAEAGHKRVKKEHLWEHRFSKFLKFLEQNYL